MSDLNEVTAFRCGQKESAEYIKRLEDAVIEWSKECDGCPVCHCCKSAEIPCIVAEIEKRRANQGVPE